MPVFGGFINYAALFKDGALWAGLVRTCDLDNRHRDRRNRD